jgi:ubiquinone biosynthesis protein
MRRSTLDKVRENVRLQQVYNIMLHYGWDMMLSERWGLLGDFHHAMQAWVWDLPEDMEPVSTPVKMRLLLQEMGPTYVKMGQIVSSQASTIPPDWEEQLALLQSNVPPFPADVARQIIIEELGQPPEVLYAHFEPQPFAAASTAQVHRAALHDGAQVVVKVQRPNIHKQMKADIGIMQNAARVFSNRSGYARSIDLEGMLEQFGKSVLDELDYTGEAYNAFRLAVNLDTLPGVHIPETYPDLSTSRVLTMEFIHGVKINNLPAIDRAGIDRATLARDTLRAIVKQLLIDGFFHADPHPGNVLVNLDTGQATFIDTGMVGELDVQGRLNLVQLMFAVQQADVYSMAEIMRNMSVPFVEHVDEKAFTRDFERKVGRILYRDRRASFGQSVNVAFSLLSEHGLRLNPNLTMAIKAMTQAEAITKLLYPEGGLIEEGVDMVKDLFVQSISAEKITEEAQKQLMIVGRELSKRLPSLSEATLGWLDQYQKGRFELHLDTSALAKEVDKLNALGRQVVIGIILVGTIIGSAIAISAISTYTTQSRLWDLFFRVSYLGYVIPMLIAILILVRLIWRALRGKPPAAD